MYFESSLAYDLPEKIVNHVNNIKPQNVFITKNLREQDYLSRALKSLEFSIEGQSLIEFKQIAIKELPETDWVFFSSKHAVRYFFDQKPNLGKVKFGCVGTATSKELRNRGFRADFIGQSNDTKLIGKQFASRAGNSKVLFPIARESMQSIQHQIINQDNVFNLPVYATSKHSKEINTDYTIIVFTHPR